MGRGVECSAYPFTRGVDRASVLGVNGVSLGSDQLATPVSPLIFAEGGVEGLAGAEQTDEVAVEEVRPAVDLFKLELAAVSTDQPIPLVNFCHELCEFDLIFEGEVKRA